MAAILCCLHRLTEGHAAPKRNPEEGVTCRHSVAHAGVPVIQRVILRAALVREEAGILRWSVGSKAVQVSELVQDGAAASGDRLTCTLLQTCAREPSQTASQDGRLHSSRLTEPQPPSILLHLEATCRALEMRRTVPGRLQNLLLSGLCLPQNHCYSIGRARRSNAGRAPSVTHCFEPECKAAGEED